MTHILVRLFDTTRSITKTSQYIFEDRAKNGGKNKFIVGVSSLFRLYFYNLMLSRA